MTIGLNPPVATLPPVPTATVKIASCTAGQFDLSVDARRLARAKLYGEQRENYPKKGETHSRCSL
jgi:hypothetical protein